MEILSVIVNLLFILLVSYLIFRIYYVIESIDEIRNHIEKQQNCCKDPYEKYRNQDGLLTTKRSE